ncbi:prenyltransferase/squalene oxidase repeat-containing protein [Micromonospora sp. NPDC048930]|uniref:prenyltransferase/squalene oxidase repeat-containing protein n=1 Tax=Micromonospora sp. NPDC048930 TaxID=3364261 RepID=UPI0037127D01
MSGAGSPGGETPADGGPDPAAEAARLVADLAASPLGRSSASPYETGRLVALAPWLTYHAERIRFLLASQRADGGWGGPEGYALVPTLSAVDGLLATLDRDEPAGWSRQGVRQAVDRALRLLLDPIAGPAAFPVPDLPACDLTVPALVERISERLADPPEGLAGWRGIRPLVPAGMNRRRFDAVRRLVHTGVPIPQKLLHALEVLGPAARCLPSVAPTSVGAIGASPAATAAWLGAPPGHAHPTVRYLAEAVAGHQGPAPCATPITVFERSWALSALARAGIPVPAAEPIAAELRAALGPEGAATGPGLPADADTTAATLYALAALGYPVDPSALFRYDLGTHFCTWQGEDGASVTTNAHVLEALHRLAAGADPRAAPVTRRVTAWLLDLQHPDGSWSDRWHASPYYATAAVLAALTGQHAREVAPAVERAVGWVLDSQHDDGSYGRWGGTAEETAYAVQVLLAGRPRPEIDDALARAVGHLRVTPDMPHPPLWHDKDLYHPPLIVRAALIGARKLADGRLRRAGVPPRRLLSSTP